VTRPVKIGAIDALEKLPGWSDLPGGRDAISRAYRFIDFNTAFAFMTRVALKAEVLDHHPEWSNVYSRVEVTLTTHDADGVTDLDVEMAQFMDLAAKALGAKD
jgi:4a-hydroxytetrahydrobiopterin dehydratase